MQKYKAKVVGLKWSPKYMSRYRPVFEYTDEYGNVKHYTRRKSLERTPFTEKDIYTIVCSKKGIYESSERLISDKFCFMCLKLFAIILTILFPSMFLFMFLLSTITTAGFVFLPKLIKQQIGHCKFNTEKIEGKIVGYQKLKRRNENGDPLYRPIIEYNYNNQIFTHMSKTVCALNQYEHMSTCEIFICNDKKVVYDIFEASQPIIDIDKFKEFIKTMKRQSKDDTKIYIPNKMRPKNVLYNKDDTMPINIPLRTLPYKKASGWY